MTQENNQSRLMSVNDVVAEFRIGRTTIYKLLKDGAFSAIKVGRLTRIPRTQIEAWFAHQPRFGSQ